MSTFVILTPGFPKDENDSTCLPAFQQFVLSLKKLYPQTQFVVVAFQYPYEKKEYHWHGNRVVCIGGKNAPGLSRIATWLKAYGILRRLKKETKILGVLSLWLSECAFIGKRFCKRNNLKHYMWLIGQDAEAGNQFVPRIKPAAEEIIAMSDFLQETFYKNYSVRPFMVAENGINPASFAPLKSSGRKIDLLGAGSLTPLKNYSLFIDIIYELHKTFPDIRSVIAGSGAEETVLKEKVKTLRLEKSIEFRGLVSHAETLELMNNSRIFLHTSNYEGNSTVLMEALYSGCKVFSTQPLSSSPTTNLTLANTGEEFVRLLSAQLSGTNEAAERVTFNTMDASAKKIMELYL